jgi:hypothetical protein
VISTKGEYLGLSTWALSINTRVLMGRRFFKNTEGLLCQAESATLWSLEMGKWPWIKEYEDCSSRNME